jgi:uncharacterized delta-60 repeat protein
MKANTCLTERRRKSAARRLRGGVAVTLVTLLALTAAMRTGRADSEQLDLSFRIGGKTVTDFFELTDEAHDVVIQPDGKIVVVGTATPKISTHDFFALVRYNADGLRDASFGTDGKVLTNFNSFEDVAEAVALQADGKIVVAGTTFRSPNSSGDRSSDFALARYNADGSLDTTFGTGGKVTTDVFGSPDFAKDVLIQPDGKIVVVGASHGFSVARYNSNGSPDTTFSPFGYVRVTLNSADDRAEAGALQPDGKIVAAGSTGQRFQFTLARFNTNGLLDSGFDGDGFAAIDFSGMGSSFDTARGVAVQPDGKIVAAGYVNGSGPLLPMGSGEALARVNPDGSPDPTFGAGGKVLTADFFGARTGGATDLALQPDGRIVAVGGAGSSDFNSTDFTVSRYNADGSPDPTFGSGGKLKTNFFDGQDVAMAVALQADGKIVAAGWAVVGLPRDFAVARYNPSATQSPALVQFSAASYSAQESHAGGAPARIFVTRTGDTSGTSTVAYSTADGSATQKSDYTIALGSVTFAPGETSKFFDVLLTQEGFARGDKVAHLFLSDPSGASLGAHGSAELLIGDDDGANTPTNPIDDSTNFVSQHYHDFLNRIADDAGLQFWTNEIEQCGADAQCRAARRVNVSAAFFLSMEFQETGFYAIRLQRVAFGRKSEVAATRLPYRQFVRDARQLGKGVVVGQPGDVQTLEANRQAYAERIVSGSDFAARFPLALTADQYVDALYASAGVAPSAAERQSAVAAFGAGGTAGRVASLRAVVESASVRNAEFNAAFVLMQYFGYLRRNPTDAPDVDDTGYQFWLSKLNQFGGNFQNAEMVKAFISAEEFRHRFGQ